MTLGPRRPNYARGFAVRVRFTEQGTVNRRVLRMKRAPTRPPFHIPGAPKGPSVGLTPPPPTPPPSGHSAAYRWWTLDNGEAQCIRGGTGDEGGGQVAIHVSDDATFGRPYGTLIQWESWMLVYDGNTGREWWQRHDSDPNFWLSYRAFPNDSGSSPYYPQAGGGALWISGGTDVPGYSGDQSWNILANQWVRPAVAVRSLDWNFTTIYSTQPSEVFDQDWCHFH